MFFNIIRKIVISICLILLVFFSVIFIGWVFEHFLGFILLLLLIGIATIYSATSNMEERANQQELDDFNRRMKEAKRK